MTKTYLEPEEVQRLEEAAEYLRDKLLIRLLFRLGCRISEALGISVGDIDFTRGTVAIEHLKLRVKLSCPDCKTRMSKTAKYCPGCGQEVQNAVSEEKEHRRTRALPIDDDTLQMLQDYIDRGGAVSYNGRQVLFGICRRQAWQIVNECARRAGLADLVNPQTGVVHHVSPHSLRDAFAILAVKRDDSGDGLRLLQEHLGHQNINTTMIYRKVAGKEHREWYQDLVPSLCGEGSAG